MVSNPFLMKSEQKIERQGRIQLIRRGGKRFFWPVRSQNVLEGVFEGKELISDEGRTTNLTPGAYLAHM